MLRGFVFGAAAVVATGLLGAYLLIATGGIPANADAKPSGLEEWAARKSLHATIARQAPKGSPPVAADDANLAVGVKIYAANCAVCHGAADGEASNIAQGLYQRAPQLAKDPVDDDEEGEIYWKVRHGIRLTGMPSFRATLAETKLWQVTLFLKHMPDLPPAAKEAWIAVPGQTTPSSTQEARHGT
jgi:mono/diheme cytochrome c family protein